MVVENNSLTFVVEGPNNTFVRFVSEASPLNRQGNIGNQAELATRTAASSWGLPDFVMQPKLVPKGSAFREIGDGMIVVGGLGLILQVKARTSNRGDDDRELAWVEKQVKKASKQVNGTLRELKKGGTFRNGRGRKISLPSDIEWVGAIVVDHPDPPSCVFALDESQIPTVLISRQEWEFLHDQLRSSGSVVEYLHRVAALGPVPFGSEIERYYQLALQDSLAPPSELDGHRGINYSEPVLPLDEHTVGPGPHHNVRLVLELMALAPLPSGVTEEERLLYLGLLDKLGVRQREEMGLLLARMLKEVCTAEPNSHRWRFRRIMFDSVQLVLGACNKFSPQGIEALGYLLRDRHDRFVKVAGSTGSTSLLVLLTPRPGDATPDVTFGAALGLLNREADEIRIAAELWPVGVDGDPVVL